MKILNTMKTTEILSKEKMNYILSDEREHSALLTNCNCVINICFLSFSHLTNYLTSKTQKQTSSFMKIQLIITNKQKYVNE